MNDVVVNEYMNVDLDDESYESCDDDEEESDVSEKSIGNEYEGDEIDNDDIELEFYDLKNIDKDVKVAKLGV